MRQKRHRNWALCGEFFLWLPNIEDLGQKFDKIIGCCSHFALRCHVAELGWGVRLLITVNSVNDSI